MTSPFPAIVVMALTRDAHLLYSGRKNSRSHHAFSL